MPRQRWVQDPKSLQLIPEDQWVPQYNDGIMIAPDLPDFVSPIDGTVVRGRRGMREHCLRHDVVPTQELVGLPTLPAVSEWKHTKHDRESIRQELARNIENARRKQRT
jgi:hypothetical protein